MHVFSKLSVVCSQCGHTAELDGSFVEDALGREPTLSAVSELFGLLKCSKCGERKVRLFDERQQLLIDHADITPCESCGRPIPQPRLAAMPESRICIDCATEMSTPACAPLIRRLRRKSGHAQDVEARPSSGRQGRTRRSSSDAPPTPSAGGQALSPKQPTSAENAQVTVVQAGTSQCSARPRLRGDRRPGCAPRAA